MINQHPIITQPQQQYVYNRNQNLNNNNNNNVVMDNTNRNNKNTVVKFNEATISPIISPLPDQYKYLSPGIIRRCFYFKIKQKFKSFVLHFDFNLKVLKLIRNGKNFKTIHFLSFETPISSTVVENLLSFRTKDLKSYEFYFPSKIERNEFETLINLIIEDPLHIKCPESVILLHCDYIYKKGKMKFSKRWFELHHNQILCFKKRTSEYPVNAIPISGLRIKIYQSHGLILRNDNGIFYFKTINENSRDEIYNKLTSLGIQKRRKSIFNERKKSVQLNIIHNPNFIYYPSSFLELHRLFQKADISLREIHIKNSLNLQDSSKDTNKTDNLKINSIPVTLVEAEQELDNSSEFNNTNNTKKNRKRMISRQSVQDLIKKFNAINNNNININNPFYLNNNEIYMKLIHRIDILNETCDEIIEFLETNRNEISQDVLDNLVHLFQDTQFDQSTTSNNSPGFGSFKLDSNSSPLLLSLQNQSLINNSKQNSPSTSSLSAIKTTSTTAGQTTTTIDRELSDSLSDDSDYSEEEAMDYFNGEEEEEEEESSESSDDVDIDENNNSNNNNSGCSERDSGSIDFFTIRASVPTTLNNNSSSSSSPLFQGNSHLHLEPSSVTTKKTTIITTKTIRNKRDQYKKELEKEHQHQQLQNNNTDLMIGTIN